MKKFITLILSAVLGSALTIAAFQYINSSDKIVKIEQISSVPAKSAVFTTDENGEIIPLDFTKVASNAMDGVVHIKSTQKIKNRSSQYQNGDPFYEFFNDDIFEHFFGPRFRYENPQQEKGPQVRIGAGSGVIISPDGYIVTNNHVVSQADEVEVTLHDNRTYKAKIIGTDPSTDLALLQIKENNLVYIPFTNSDGVSVGEWVLAIGNPFNLNSTVTAGIVSAKGRNINILDDKSAIESFIQTDAAINPGNSGGALVDLNGGLIGINTAIASPTGTYAGYGFAVPSNIVKKVVYDIMEFGNVQRGFLGVLIRDVNSDLAKENNLNVTKGVFVDSLMENGAAKAAGIQHGDVILKVDDIAVNSSPELQELIARHRPGEKVDILINRKGKEKTYNITLNNKDGNTKIVKPEEKNVLDLLGVELKPIDKKLADKLAIPGGLIIEKLSPGKLQNETDIKEGFIITKINNKPVKSVEEFVQQVEDKKGGFLLEGIYENYPGSLYYAFGF